MSNTVSRRTALAATAGAAAAPLAAPAYAQGRRVLRMATSWPADLALLSDAAANSAATISALSDDRLSVEVFPAGSLMGAFEVHDAVGNGDIELYHTCEYYFQGKHPAMNFFTSVPLGLLMPEQHGWFRYGGGQELWDELNAQFGVRAIACGGTGVQMGGWFEQPITSVEDYQSLTMRIPGLGGAVLRELGAQTVVTPAGQIVDALFAGEINALEWVGPNDDLNFGFPKLLANYLYPGFQEPGTVSSLGITRSLWDSLDDRDRLIIETAADIENSRTCARYYGNNGLALFQMQQEFGTRPTRLPDEVFDELARTAFRVRRDVASVDDIGSRVYNSFTEYQQGLVEWNAESFAAYFERRDALSGAYEQLF
ncbi:MAG: ABC transporter substrate-binding protein [Pseudomonadota bacterium]